MRKILMSSVAALAAVVTISAATPASAAIVSAVGGTINSSGPGFGTLTETFDQSGLISGYTSGVTDFDAYIATNPLHNTIFAGNEWFSNSDTTSASVTYDLGSVLNINKMALWNEESSGIGLLDLLVSTDGIAFVSLLSGIALADTPNGDGPAFFYGPSVLSFVTTSMRYMRLDMSRCPQPDGDFPSCSIGEVAFSTAVPIPGGALLLITGLGALGAAGLRRRKQSA